MILSKYDRKRSQEHSNARGLYTGNTRAQTRYKHSRRPDMGAGDHHTERPRASHAQDDRRRMQKEIEMKKLVVLLAALAIIIVGPVFAEPGINGWTWNGSKDSGFAFVKTLDEGVRDPVFQVIGGLVWEWGLQSKQREWSDVGEQASYQFDNNPIQDRAFSTWPGGWMYQRMDLNQFLKYSTVMIRIGMDEKYHCDLKGLRQTMQMAGLLPSR